MPINTYTFKRELHNKVFRYAHKKPIIYFMTYSPDKFIDNTKDRWREDKDLLRNRGKLLDDINQLSRFDYWVNREFYEIGYLDICYILGQIRLTK